MAKQIVEEHPDVPLIYPLIEVTYRTVAIVNGRRMDTNASTVLNMDQMTQNQAATELGLVLAEFEKYVAKVVETVDSEQGQTALQNILDNHSPAQSTSEAEPPSSPDPSLEEDPVSRMGSVD